jgi:tRNA U38,U39,U40 pseudouridine synthase TruA
MATKTSSSPDITVLEYGRLEDTIDARIRDGQRRFTLDYLVETAEISEPKVREAMRHLQGKHDYISQTESDEWHFAVPLGDEDEDQE